MKNLATIGFITLFILLCSISLAQESIVKTGSTLSQFRLEQKIQSIVDEISVVDESINATTAAIQEIEARKEQVEKLELNFEQTQNTLNQLKNLLNKWSELTDDQKIPKGEMYNFRNNLGMLIEMPMEDLQRIISDIRSYYFPSRYRSDEGDFSYLKHFGIALRQAGDISRSFDGTDQLYMEFDVLTRNFESNDDGLIDTPYRRIKSYIPSIANKFKAEKGSFWKNTIQVLFDSEKKQAIVWLEKIIKKLTEHKIKLSQKISDLESELIKYDKQYQALINNKEKAKRLTSSYESLSVNFMIGGIILILIILLFMSRGNKDIAEKLIERRTLVEILSMGFLLLAVIILGTSDKITAETLGTLLGTIAGYVFGKQMAERSGQESSPNKAISADAKSLAAE